MKSDQSEIQAISLASVMHDGANEIAQGFGRWSVWRLLAANDVKRRYRRSRLGQFWFTLSLAVFIFGLSIILGGLFGSTIGKILPWLSISFVLWTFMSTVLLESCTCLIEAEHFMKQTPMPVSVYVLRLLYRNFIIMLHNVPIILLVFLLAQQPVRPVAILAIVGLAIVLVFLFALSILISMMSARFRDVPQVVQIGIQLLFFLTPVMFKPEQMSPHVWTWLWWNPVQSMIASVREPLLGEMPALADLTYASAVTLGAAAIALFALGRYARKVVYWI